MSTTTYIDLQAFCGSEDTRYRFKSPFVAGEWRYATDGRIAVRVPAPGEPNSMDDTLSFPPCGSLFENAPAITQPWPERLYCPQCFDVGTIGVGAVKCEDCGEVSYPDPMGERKCLLCNGVASGQVIFREPFHKLRVGGRLVKVKYDALIRTLKNVKFSDGPSNGDADMIAFAFDGGEGRVMKVRD